MSYNLDADSLPNDWEICYSLDPEEPNGDDGNDGDPDSDFVTNYNEWLSYTFPNSNIDSDSDGMADDWENSYGIDDPNGDPDNDRVLNSEEYSIGTHPTQSPYLDLDSDGMADDWETFYNLNDPTLDPDMDKVSNLDEFIQGTDPKSASDVDNGGAGDGLPDDWEEFYGDISMFYDGNDEDGDGVNDEDEFAYGTSLPDNSWWGTDPTDPDTDGDLIDDKYEIDNSLDPTDSSDKYSDYDNDDMTAFAEYNYDPYQRTCYADDPDSDDDGWWDGVEKDLGASPVSSGSHPAEHIVRKAIDGLWDCNGDGIIQRTNDDSIVNVLAYPGDGKTCWTEDYWVKPEYLFVKVQMDGTNLASLSRTYLDSISFRSDTQYNHDYGLIDHARGLHIVYTTDNGKQGYYWVYEPKLVEGCWTTYDTIDSGLVFDHVKQNQYIRWMEAVVIDENLEALTDKCYVIMDYLSVTYTWRKTP